MKTIYFILFATFFSLTLVGQTYNYPSTAVRFQKTVAITSIEILPQSIKVNMEYLGSQTDSVGWMNISPETQIKTIDGIYANLKSTKGIEIAPKKTETKKGVLYKFTLEFELIEDLEKTEFSIIESESYFSFNFYNISLENNTESDESNIAKDDYFFTQIPESLRYLYISERFSESTNFDTRTIFDELIQESFETKIESISKISLKDFQEYSKKLRGYILDTDLPTTKSSSYYYDYNEGGERIFKIAISFNSKQNAALFLKSICAWYGASLNEDSNYAMKLDFWGKEKYNAMLFALGDDNQKYEVVIMSLSMEELQKIQGK
jgi:hypothetical protein